MKPALRTILFSRFSPSSLYPAAGLWLDPSYLSSAYQESTKVTGGAIDAPVGYRESRGGNIAGVLQATSGARPALKLDGDAYFDLMDGTDDGYASASFDAGTLTADMDCFIAMKRNSAAQFALCFQTAGSTPYFGYAEAAGGGTAFFGCGSNVTHFVNGVAVPGGVGTTADQLNTAITVGQWLILEVRNLDLSAWTAFAVAFDTAYVFGGNVGGLILCPAQTETRRAHIRKWLAAKVGLAL